MLTNQQIDKINNTISNKVFNYSGPLINGVDRNVDINFKIEFLGYKQMISVGDYYNYLKVGVTIVELKDELSKLVISGDNGSKNDGSMDWKGFFQNSLYHFYHNLEFEIISNTWYYTKYRQANCFIISRILVLSKTYRCCIFSTIHIINTKNPLTIPFSVFIFFRN